MRDEQCPKCGKTVEPIWHKECDDSHLQYKSRSEHLHYFCKCTYDWGSSITVE